ncbi:hypothetical protein CYMTET_22367 [Cymbomonas tetramitiformis]|uniref:Uncharacterized protein n=1 Tax=Cymbomonas tetramitiformis TaxID=36881 RepID=A0AAE0G0Y0_9CHLO|nr:hypothetical protein CYMTET_22367 [Cymbomonas tetramitiformis]
MHCAAYKGETLCGLALIRMGADVRVVDKRERSPITAAITAGFREAAKAFEDEAARPRDPSLFSTNITSAAPTPRAESENGAEASEDIGRDNPPDGA